MGPRLGKFVYYSYNMSDRCEKKSNKDSEEIRSDAPSASGSSSGGSQKSEQGRNSLDVTCQIHDVTKESDDQSDGKSSTGSGETTCTSWRTRSENWSKKRRTFKGGGGSGGSSTSSKKDFFGKRNKKWPMKKSKEPSDIESPPTGSLSCVCTMYRRTSEAEAVAGPSDTVQRMFTGTAASGVAVGQSIPIIDLSKFNPADYPIDDEDERMRQQRAKEMQEGVELSALMGGVSIRDNAYPAHSQVDFIHYLVPDLKEITNCSFYWGKIDRYEAEKLLEGKPEGTFLLRDSAQEEYLFSVSFRRYGRSLHARIEQWNNQFSFDSHDPSVYSSFTVTGLIGHYKDPSSCMFFEPMLTTPLHRNFPFGLQHLSRATICSNLKYDSINALPLPKSLNMYLKEYHYKQRVRARRLE